MVMVVLVFMLLTVLVLVNWGEFICGYGSITGITPHDTWICELSVTVDFNYLNESGGEMMRWSCVQQYWKLKVLMSSCLSCVSGMSIAIGSEVGYWWWWWFCELMNTHPECQLSHSLTVTLSIYFIGSYCLVYWLHASWVFE